MMWKEKSFQVTLDINITVQPRTFLECENCLLKKMKSRSWRKIVGNSQKIKQRFSIWFLFRFACKYQTSLYFFVCLLGVSLLERSRADMYKFINPDYYGYRDEDDGILIAKEAAKEVYISKGFILLLQYYLRWFYQKCHVYTAYFAYLK